MSLRRVAWLVAGWGSVAGYVAGCSDAPSTPGAATGGAGTASASGGASAGASTGGAGASAGTAISAGGEAQSGSGGELAAAGSGQAGAGGEAALLPPFDWVGVLGTGQSLSIGATAGFISLTQPYGNLALLDSGADPKYPLSGGQPAWSLVPLVEPLRAKVAGTGAGYADGQYPNNIAGETPHSGMANTLSLLWQQRGVASDYVSIHSAFGWSGHALVDIDKSGGKRAYPASLLEAKALVELAKQQGKSFGYGAIIMTHGESDAANPDYAQGLYQLLQDYNTDLKAITGQAENVVMLVSQQSSKPTGIAGSGAQVFRAGVEHPGEIICTGPKYAYQYGPDKLHMGAAGYRRLGEKYAEVFDQVVVQKLDWQPLGPTGATRAGNVIKVDFHVPEPPLVWSEHLAPPHQTLHTEWAKGRGFEVVTGADVAVTIAAAEIQGDAVLLTLENPPAVGTQLTVRYAITQDGELNQGGDVLGLRGLLRDSDALVGADAETISVKLTQGSSAIASTDLGAFRRRTGYDIVSENDVPTGLVVRSRDSDEQLTLSAPWPGPSGTRSLSFHYDLYNYCVHFSLVVD